VPTASATTIGSDACIGDGYAARQAALSYRYRNGARTCATSDASTLAPSAMWYFDNYPLVTAAYLNGEPETQPEQSKSPTPTMMDHLL